MAFPTAVNSQITDSVTGTTPQPSAAPAFNHRVAVLGAGKMGGILLGGFLGKNLISRENATATVAHADEAARVHDKLGIAVGTNNADAVKNADIILIAVKPQVVTDVLAQIRPNLKPSQLVISVAASVPTYTIEQALGSEIPVVRAMPNTPCLVGQGMTAICKGKFTTPAHVATTQALFGAVGRTVVIEEKLMDAATGLSASGPAFIYIILESLAEAGVKVGLPRETATLMAAQTMLGSAQVALETGDHPALLKDAVTTPAGCTIDGIMEIEEGKLRVTLIKAVVKAAQRAKELGNKD